MITVTRREFIVKTATVAALAAVGSAVPMAGFTQDAVPDDLQWHKAPCRFCGTGCGVLAGIKDGRVVAVQGDLKCPVNKGLLCAKGYHLGAALYAKDRLTTPQIRRDGELQDRDLPRELLQDVEAAGGQPIGEKERVLDALERSGWNRTQASRLLGIDRSTLWRRMRKLEIDAERGASSKATAAREGEAG